MPQNGEREDWGNQRKYCNYKSYAGYVNVVDAPQDDSTHSYGHVRRTNKIVNFTRHTHTHTYTNKQIILYGEKKNTIYYPHAKIKWRIWMRCHLMLWPKFGDAFLCPLTKKSSPIPV